MLRISFYLLEVLRTLVLSLLLIDLLLLEPHGKGVVVVQQAPELGAVLRLSLLGLHRREGPSKEGVCRHLSEVWWLILQPLMLLDLPGVGACRLELGTWDQPISAEAVRANLLLREVRRESLLACGSKAARLLSYQRLRRFRGLDPLAGLRIPLENIEKLALVLWIPAQLHGSVVLVGGCLLVAVVESEVVVLARPHVELLEVLLVGALV